MEYWLMLVLMVVFNWMVFLIIFLFNIGKVFGKFKYIGYVLELGDFLKFVE